MLRSRLAFSSASLLALVVVSVALLTVSDASKADHDAADRSVTETQSKPDPLADDARVTRNKAPEPSLGQRQEQSASEVQYPGDEEAYVYPLPPEKPQRSQGERGLSSTVYYDFYSRWLAQEDGEPEVSKATEAPSEGSAPGARAHAEALSIMEPPTPYSQVVDNASSRRFLSTQGWKKAASKAAAKRAEHYGADYEYVRPESHKSRARFKVKIPDSGYYTVYARWPAARGNNPATSFRIGTASGTKKIEVNQRKDGGVWVRLGAYEMKAGDRYSVQVARNSKAEGRIVADAVKVVGGTQAPPQAHASHDGAADERTYTGKRTGENVEGSEVILRARTHIGTPYRHSPPMPCEAYRSEDCSCFTKLVYDKWLTLVDDPVQQWQEGRSIEKSALLPGDLVFFKEAGKSNPITHVGIYSGNGNIIHSSTYWGGVVERPMASVSGYYGAKRLK